MNEEQFKSTIDHLPKDLENRIQESEIDNDSDDDSDDENHSSEQILFCQLLGKQEIFLTTKETDHLQGPKIQLEMQFGCLNLFLSPRQLHMLTYFSEKFFSENTSPATNVNQGSQVNEFDLNTKLNQLKLTQESASGGFGLNQGWSTEQSCKYYTWFNTNFRS